MADRFTLKVFAGSGLYTGQFGSFINEGGSVGDGTMTNNPTTIQALSAWNTGWNAATNAALQLPRIEEENAVSFVLSSFMVYNWNDGITFWSKDITPTAYQTIVQYQVSTNMPRIYVNTTGVNTSTNPAGDTTNWKEVLDLSKDYVDTTTSQTIISGTKTFGTNSRLILQDDAALNVNLVNTSFDWTATSSTKTKLSEMQTKDANGVVCSSLNTYAGANNERVAVLQAFKPDGTDGAYVQAYYNTALGVGYGVAPTPPAGAYGNEIVTAAWVTNYAPDKNLSNLSTTGNNKVANLAMPSTRNVTLNIDVSGAVYTAPNDGWFVVSGFDTSTIIQAYNTDTNLGYNSTGSGNLGSLLAIPCKAGYSVTIKYSGQIGSFKFVYAEGAI